MSEGCSGPRASGRRVSRTRSRAEQYHIRGHSLRPVESFHVSGEQFISGVKPPQAAAEIFKAGWPQDCNAHSIGASLLTFVNNRQDLCIGNHGITFEPRGHSRSYSAELCCELPARG